MPATACNIIKVMESCQQNLSTRRRCYCISLRNRSGPSGNTQSAASLRPSIDASTAACRGIPAPNGTRTFFLLFFRTSAHQHAFTFNNALLVFRYVLSMIFGFNFCTKKSVKFCLIYFSSQFCIRYVNYRV